MSGVDGFVPITALFYSVFHPTEGTKVVHQVPSGSIVPPPNDDNRINNNLPDSSSFEQPLFDFDTIKNYVIPKPSLCNKLISLKIDNYRVLGFPVNIYAPQYARNSFGFNFCFVFPYESDTTPYEGNIKRIGRMFRALEEQSQLLSKSLEESHMYFQDVSQSIVNVPAIPAKFNMSNNKYYRVINDWDDTNKQLAVQKNAPGLNTETQNIISSIESLIQQIFQDLNNYSECKISIDASNAVDLKLFPISPPPPHVHSHHVPIALLKLESLIDSLWDPTMLKVSSFINGVNSISKISTLSNVNLDLTKECIRHFIHYKAVTIIDIFQFSNHYMITSSIGNFLRDPLMAANCQDYVLSPHGSFSKLKPDARLTRNDSNSNSINSKLNEFTLSTSYSTPKLKKPEFSGFVSSQFETQQNATQIKKVALPSKSTLFQLYNSLNSHKSVAQWYTDNQNLLEYIDIRKFITFGVRNGLIARIHEYPVSGKFDKTNRDAKSGISMSLESDLDAFSPELSGVMGKIKNLNVSSLPLLNDDTLNKVKENKNKYLAYNKASGITSVYEDTNTSDSDSSSSDESEDNSEDGDKFQDVNEMKIKQLQKSQELRLLRILKHTPHMDSICTSMKLSRAEVYAILERIGDVEIIES